MDEKVIVNQYLFEVACGSHHSVVLEKKPDQDGGHVWSFGLPNNGRLGRVGTSLPELVVFPDATRIARIACGSDHTLAISEHGQVFAWGIGNYGNLGLGTSEDVHEPQLISALDQRHTVQVACGPKHSLALNRGKIGWNVAATKGDNWDLGTPMVFIAAGEAHSACLTDLGTVYVWGAGAYGRTGHGEETDSPVPRKVESLGGIPCVRVALGMLHSVVLTAKGKLYAWGAGAATGLVTADASIVPTPREVQLPQVFVEVRCGTKHTVALSQHGDLFAWGVGTDGRLGLGSTDTSFSAVGLRGVRGWKFSKQETALVLGGATTPEEAQKDDVANLKHIACGGSHSAVLLNTGALYCWGSNEFGQVGVDPKSISSKDIFDPYLHHTIVGKVTHVACGLEHTVAIADARLWVWGRGDKGQLGLGKSKEAREPCILMGLTDVVHCAAGEDHTCAVLASGELYTWGSAECGKLGHGSSMITASQYLPRQVKMSDRIESVFCGAEHSALVNAQGHVFAFGAGWFGRLGIGSTMNAYVPTRIDIPPVAKRNVFCGSFHTCFVIQQELWITGQDRVVCSPDHLLSPTKFALFEEDEIKILTCAVAPQHTMCISTEGKLYVWGENKKGQLGLGRMQARVDEPDLNRMLTQPALMIATSYGHSLVLTEDGLYGMGSKNSGRLTLPVRGQKQKEAYKPTLVHEAWKQQTRRVEEEESSVAETEDKTGGKRNSRNQE